MRLFLCLFLCFCASQKNSAHPTGFLKTIKAGLSEAGKSVKCGLHTVGNVFVKHEHQHDPCGKISDNNIDTTETYMNYEDTAPSIDVRYQDFESTTAVIKVPQGKRIISVGSNCPPGYVGDGRGNCREQY